MHVNIIVFQLFLLRLSVHWVLFFLLIQLIVYQMIKYPFFGLDQVAQIVNYIESKVWDVLFTGLFPKILVNHFGFLVGFNQNTSLLLC